MSYDEDRISPWEASDSVDDLYRFMQVRKRQIARNTLEAIEVYEGQSVNGINFVADLAKTFVKEMGLQNKPEQTRSYFALIDKDFYRFTDTEYRVGSFLFLDEPDSYAMLFEYPSVANFENIDLGISKLSILGEGRNSHSLCFRLHERVYTPKEYERLFAEDPFPAIIAKIVELNQLALRPVSRSEYETLET